jgi:hypothetical protein
LLAPFIWIVDDPRANVEWPKLARFCGMRRTHIARMRPFPLQFLSET